MLNSVIGVSVLEFAYLAQDVYNDDTASKANLHNLALLWQAAKDLPKYDQPEYADEFFSRLYFRYPMGSAIPDAAVLAFRGTQPFEHLLGPDIFNSNDADDIRIALGITPHSEILANHFYTLAFNYSLQYPLSLKLTGHSLGGALAQLTAIAPEQLPPSTVVFNSPGVGDLQNKKEDYDFIQNFNASDGEINKIGKTIGHVTELNVQQGEGEKSLARMLQSNPNTGYGNTSAEVLSSMGDVEQHVMADVLAALKSNPTIENEIF